MLHHFRPVASVPVLLAMSYFGLGAPEAVAGCWDFPIASTGIQSAVVVVDRGRTAVGLPEIGRAFVVSAGLSESIELRPPPGDAFADGSGFGTSMAVDGDIVAVGAVRIGGHRAGVEQPAGVFHIGAVYTFDVSNGAFLWHSMSDSERVFGHSVSVDEYDVAFGVYEAPGLDGGSVRLRGAAHGAIALRSRGGAPLRVVNGPSDARGFGAKLSGRAPLITTSASADTLGIWALQDGIAILLASMPATLNGIPATHVAAKGSTTAVSAGGGFSSDAGRTLVMVPGSTPYEITAGGPLAISEDRLSVLIHAAPEGQQHNTLIVYDISIYGAPVEVAKLDHVIGAAIEGRTAFVVLAEPGAAVRLCEMGT